MRTSYNSNENPFLKKKKKENEENNERDRLRQKNKNVIKEDEKVEKGPIKRSS